MKYYKIQSRSQKIFILVSADKETIFKSDLSSFGCIAHTRTDKPMWGGGGGMRDARLEGSLSVPTYQGESRVISG
jgi:hypothetical protein